MQSITKENNHGRHVLCVGAAVLDTLFRVHDMPTGQGKVLPYEMLQIAEGMASSAAYTVHRMGGRASLWGAVGMTRPELASCVIYPKAASTHPA